MSKLRYDIRRGVAKAKTRITMGIAALAVALGGSASLALVGAANAATTNIKVTPSNMQGWSFINDQTDGAGSGSLVIGPGSPPLGVGSAHFELSGSTDGQIVAKAAYQGVKLSDLTSLTYSTYVSSATTGNAQAVALQFNVSNGISTAYQGRIVFEPYQNADQQTLAKDSWQSWDAINSGNAKWWFSKPSFFSGQCGQASPCTWDYIKTQFANVQIHPTYGAVVLKAGSGWNDFDGNVDALTVGVQGDNTIYDFEPYAVATDKDQCKQGGWMGLADSNGNSFKNQGDCVSFVATGNKNKASSH
jgi:hypothetical protein